MMASYLFEVGNPVVCVHADVAAVVFLGCEILVFNFQGNS